MIDEPPESERRDPPPEPAGTRPTQRERRAERHRAEQRRQMPAKVGKSAAIGVAVLLALAGGVYAWQHLPEGAKFGHEHSVLKMFEGDAEIRFDDPRFDFATTKNPRAHLHLSGAESSSAQYAIHAEGRLGITLDYFFDAIGVHVEQDRIDLDATAHGGRSIHNNETRAWQLWVDACADGPDNWAKAGSIGGYHPKQHDRMLIAWAPRDANATTLSPLLSQVPSHAELESQLKDSC